jgi:hypothetical protein
VLVGDRPGAELLPVSVDAEPPTSWARRLDHVRDQLARAREHRPFGLPLLRRAARIARIEADPVVPDAALVIDEAGWHATLREHPSLELEVPLVLVDAGAGRFHLRARTDARACSRVVAILLERLGRGEGLAREALVRELGPASTLDEPEFVFDS